MMRTLLAGFALAALALGAPAQASEGSYAQCQKAAGGVDPQLHACDAAEITSRDAVLNQSYRKLLAAITPARQALLRTAERDWIAFRDAECAFRRSADAGGSDAVLVYDACRLDLTARRIDDLGKALNVSRF